MPKTSLGKWSVKLIILFFLLLATGMFVVSALGQRGGETIFDNLTISIPMLSSGTSAIAAFFIGVLSIWKYKERSIFVFWFVLGEILVPH